MTIKWVQWAIRTGEIKAFAVDEDAELINGKVRSVNGSIVPDSAVEADPSTPQDAFCVSILAGRQAKLDRKAEKAANKAVKPPKTEKVKEPKLRIGKLVTKVMLGNVELGKFESAKLAADVPATVRMTDKSWAVYQGEGKDKKRVAIGKIESAEETAEATA